MLRHHHVAEDSEAQLFAEIVQGCNQLQLEAIGVKDPGATINILRQIVRVILTVVVDSGSHRASLLLSLVRCGTTQAFWI